MDWQKHEPAPPAADPLVKRRRANSEFGIQPVEQGQISPSKIVTLEYQRKPGDPGHGVTHTVPEVQLRRVSPPHAAPPETPEAQSARPPRARSEPVQPPVARVSPRRRFWPDSVAREAVRFQTLVKWRRRSAMFRQHQYPAGPYPRMASSSWRVSVRPISSGGSPGHTSRSR